MPETITADELIGDPVPPPTAPAAAASAVQQPTHAAPNVAVECDKRGTPFDAAKHLPKMHPTTGAWMPRRKAAAAAPASGSFIAPDPAPSPVAPGAVAENATCETVIGLLQMLLVLVGEEEGVLTDAEKMLLRTPLLRLLAKYEVGADVLPAEVEVLFAVAGIVIERIKRSGKTATAFAKLKAWVAGALFRRQGAAVGAQLRREVPINLVASLQAKVQRLEEQLAAKAAAQAAPMDEP